MYLAYIDESGDPGDYVNGGSKTFTLACVLVEAKQWPSLFDRVIGFRRALKADFGIPVRAELKANYLLRNGGPYLRDLALSEAARYRVYRNTLRLVPKLGLTVFAVVIRKQHAIMVGKRPQDIAWQYLIQRLERFSTKSGNPIMVIHDEGEGPTIKGFLRKSRRAGSAGMAFGQGGLSVPFSLLIDDPVSRKSDQSYFLQFSDLAAYAAFRAVVTPEPRPVQIVPSAMWDELGAARLAAVTALKGGGHMGIVKYPWP